MERACWALKRAQEGGAAGSNRAASEGAPLQTHKASTPLHLSRSSLMAPSWSLPLPRPSLRCAAGGCDQSSQTWVYSFDHPIANASQTVGSLIGGGPNSTAVPIPATVHGCSGEQVCWEQRPGGEREAHPAN